MILELFDAEVTFSVLLIPDRIYADQPHSSLLSTAHFPGSRAHVVVAVFIRNTLVLLAASLVTSGSEDMHDDDEEDSHC